MITKAEISRLDKFIKYLKKELPFLEALSKKDQTGGLLPFIPLLAALGPLIAKGAVAGAATYAGTKAMEKIAGKGIGGTCVVCHKSFKDVKSHMKRMHEVKKKGGALKRVAKPQ